MSTWGNFRKLLSDQLSLSNVETICFDLDIDFEDIKAEDKTATIVKLLTYIRRREMVDKLIAELQDMYDHINWQDEIPTDAVENGADDKRSAVITNPQDDTSSTASEPGSVEPAPPVDIQNQDLPGAATPDKLAAGEQWEAPESGLADEPIEIVTETNDTSNDTPIANTSTPVEPPRVDDTPNINPETPAKPEIRPVQDDEYMIIVTEFEQLGEQKRQAHRFIKDRLVQTFESDVPISNLRVRPYPDIITSKGDADAIAQEFGAAVIVWGNYDDLRIEVNIQTGSTDIYPENNVDRSHIEQSANVRAIIDDERISLASLIMSTMFATAISCGDYYSIIQMAALSELTWQQVDQVPLMSKGVAAHNYQANYHLYNDELDDAQREMDAALDLVADNPVLYFLRSSITFIKDGYEAAEGDLLAARRLSPDNWLQPVILLGGFALFKGKFQTTVDVLDEVIAAEESWFPLYLRALAKYYLDDLIGARADNDRALQLNPKACWPFLTEIMITLRDGDISSINKETVPTIVANFKDIRILDQALLKFVGRDSVLRLLVVAFGNLLIGKYQAAYDEIDKTIEHVSHKPAMLYMLYGAAAYGLEEFQNAIDFYSQALDIQPDFWLLYVLRADAYQKLGHSELSQQDFSKVFSADIPDSLITYAKGVQSGELSSNTLMNIAN